MKSTKVTAVLATALLLLLAACKGNQSTETPPAQATPPAPAPAAAPVVAGAHHPIVIHDDHKGDSTNAESGDYIDWSVEHKDKDYWVCFQDEKNTCGGKNKFQVPADGYSCNIDGDKLPAYYDVAHDEAKCGEGHKKQGREFTTAHCDGCVINQGP